MSFLDNTAGSGFSITPDDDNDLAQIANAIYCGGAGDIVLVTPSGAQLTFSAVAAGTVLPFKAKKVLATGTTATNLIGAIHFN
jgi:hypothetical protein